ncbi:MAG: SIMPL domain-containing protein [Alphaproteobacteria bacterium]|nr:SIMPL domain-containing protein [Alphaproteobacteria bacterium]
MKFLAISIISSALIATPAYAQDIQLLPEGQTLVTLSVTERMQVPQDTLHASLRIEETNKNPKALQDTINKATEKAVKAAKEVKDVKTSTGYYSVYQYNNSNSSRENMKWRGSQTINLESKNTEALLELAGEIQDMGFAMNNLNYTLSTEKADEVRDSMMEAALVRAREKANRAAKALNKSDVDIAMVNVDASTNFAQPMRVMRSNMMASDAMEMAAPTAEAGESEVTLTVTVNAVAK